MLSRYRAVYGPLNEYHSEDAIHSNICEFDAKSDEAAIRFAKSQRLRVLLHAIYKLTPIYSMSEGAITNNVNNVVDFRAAE